jgi:ComEC/Rec2-related protein
LRRYLSRVRTTVPALLFTVGVCAGEVGAWFFSPVLIVATVSVLGLVTIARGVGRGGALVGVGVGLAIGGAELATHPSIVAGSDAQLLIQVEDPPRRRVPGEVVFLGREVTGGEGRLIRFRAVDLPWRALSSVQALDLVWVRGALLPIARPFNPFSWDGWLWRRGVSGEMKVLFGSKPLLRSQTSPERVREWIIESVERVTEESRGGALFLSMAFGVRDVLSPPVEGLFTDLGLSHLLVVSGYQVSLVFGLALSALLGIGRSIHASLGMRRIAIGVSLMCATLYVLAIGAEMSSVRALLAAVCLCLSLLTQRQHRFAQRLVVTFLCMHIVWPWALFEVGVVLTFAALTGIGIGSVAGAGSRLRSLVWVTVSVWALTSAVTVVWNGRLSVCGLVLNLALAAPWSVLNCTVGVGGLALLATGLPGSDLGVRIVGYLNEGIVSGLFWVYGAVGPTRELSLYERVIAAIGLGVTSIVMARVALQRVRGVSLRAMVHGGSSPGRSEWVRSS